MKKFLSPFLLPALLLAFAGILSWQWEGAAGWLSAGSKSRAFLTILPVLPYLLGGIGCVLGWRYGNTGLMLACLVLCLAYSVSSGDFGTCGNTRSGGIHLGKAAVFLLPLNLVVASLLQRRRLFSSPGLLGLSMILAQILFLALLGAPQYKDLAHGLSGFYSGFKPILERLGFFLAGLFSGPGVLCSKLLGLGGLAAFGWSLAFLFWRYAADRNPLSAGLFAAGLASLCAFSQPVGEIQVVFLSASLLILLFASIEDSFSMAYLDELTGLPGRRSLNEALLNLGRKYAIAMVDVDHFKKFNDRYGHRTGDQVLKMIAVRMRKMGGGAKCYRYGGEEFTAILAGKNAEEARPHLEALRQDISDQPFVVRSRKRKRSTADQRGRSTLSAQSKFRVTVSIGLAEPSDSASRPEQVVKMADKALYKAKKAGRNRVV